MHKVNSLNESYCTECLQTHNVCIINNNGTRVLSGPVCLSHQRGFYAQQAKLLKWLICDHSNEISICLMHCLYILLRLGIKALSSPSLHW